jgi:Ca2+-binding EF-hand superfamily protein
VRLVHSLILQVLTVVTTLLLPFYTFSAVIEAGVSKDGAITEEQFIASLMGQQQSLSVPPEELSLLFGYMDTANTGAVTLLQVVDVVGPSGRTVEDLHSRLRNRLKEVKLLVLEVRELLK